MTSELHSGTSARAPVGTQEFAQAVIARLGQMPQTFAAVHYANAPVPSTMPEAHPSFWRVASRRWPQMPWNYK